MTSGGGTLDRKLAEFGIGRTIGALILGVDDWQSKDKVVVVCWVVMRLAYGA